MAISPVAIDWVGQVSMASKIEELLCEKKKKLQEMSRLVLVGIREPDKQNTHICH